MSIKTPVTISVIWIIVSPILFFLEFGSGYIFPLNIIVPVIIMPVFPILSWIIYFISLIVKRNKIKDQNKYNAIINADFPSAQDKQSAINSIQIKRLVVASIISSSSTILFIIISAIIKGFSRKNSVPGGVTSLEDFYVFFIIIGLEIVSIILAIISIKRTKKIQNMSQGLMNQKGLCTTRTVLFITVLLWPILLYLLEFILSPIMNYYFSRPL